MKQIPFQYFFLGIFLIIFVIVLRSKATLRDLFEAANSIDQNPMAIIVLIIGCIMALEGKAFGVPENAADIIIGYGGGLLQGQIKRELSTRTSTDASGAKETTTTSTILPPATASNSDEVKP